MGLLDQKERILDVVLTDRGRDQLSKNLLNFKYYAFSDEGIDYSGSLVYMSASSGSTIDSYMHRGLSFEADARTNFKESFTNTDLKSFLYTIPQGSREVPEFVTSADPSQTISLVRRYVLDSLVLHTKKRNSTTMPLAAIMRATVSKQTLESKISNYAIKQQTYIANTKFDAGKNIIGMSVGKEHVMLSGNKLLNTKTGAMSSVASQADFSNFEEKTEATDIKKDIEMVSGLDQKTIDFRLRTIDAEIMSKDGFLIEIYDSGSDGKLTRLFNEDIENPANDETIEEGFSSFLNLGIDK